MTASDPDLKARLVAAWDHGAASYDATPRHGIRHDDEWVAWRRLVAAILGDPTHADVRPLRVLDVGTGTGVLALVAAELGHQVTGVDLSEAMLGEARRKAMAAGLDLDLRIADAEALPAGLVGFDVVLARHVAWTLPDPGRALAAWRDAARPGGLIAVIDGVSSPPPWPLSWVTRSAAALVERRHRSDDPSHAYPADAIERLPLARQSDTRAMQGRMRDAGLEHVRVRWLQEIDRVERAHLSTLERLGDAWRRYLATGRTPVLTA